MAGIRSFVHVLGVSALALSPSAFAQAQTGERGVFRTLGEAVASGLFETGPRGGGFGVGLGPIGPVDACVMDAACVQPNDNITGFNAAAFSTAETVTVGETGTINRFCAQFIFAPGGACPPTNTHPALTIDWTLDFFDVLPDGDVDESSLVSFDTDVLANMVVSVSDGGVFGGAFMITSVSMDLTAGGGMPVTAGQTIAINPQYRGLGGSCGNFFWATSSNVGDGSPTGDSLALFDQSGTDDWSTCEYVDNDLMVCLDIAAGPPVATPDFGVLASNDECDSPTPIACDTTFVQCTRFATANTMTDPAFACQSTTGLDDTFTGLHTVWYSVTPTSGRVRVDTCNLRGDPNFMLQVFRVAENAGEGVGPCDLILLACSDNDCRFGANVCMNDVVPGEELIVQVGAATSFDAVDLELTVTCDPMDLPEAPVNDECIDAIQLFSNPMPGPFEIAFHTGSTECASLDPMASSCAGGVTGISPGVWFTAVGDGTMWDLNNCFNGDGYDSQINIYCGDCETGLVCITGNDDGASCAPDTQLFLCTELGRTYYILVHGFFDVGFFGLEVTANFDFSGECTNSPTHDELCFFFDVECPPDADIIESEDAAALMEMCGQDVNNGCLSLMAMGTSAPFIEAGTLPFTACAQIDSTNALPESDAYRFTVYERSVVTFRMLAEFDPRYFLFDSDNCDENFFLMAQAGVAGTDLITSATLNPGDYVLVASSDAFNGLPCGTQNDYVLRVEAAPLGRCCIVDETEWLFTDCLVTTHGVCSELGGVFDGGQDCGPVQYDVSDLGTLGVYESIVGLANEVVIDGEEGDDLPFMNPLGDEALEIVDVFGPDSELLDGAMQPASFPFVFYNELVETIAVTSNGYITMQTHPVISASPAPLGTPGTDGSANHFIAPLWRDLDPSSPTVDAPNGLVSMVIQGAAPSRTLVVEYQFVAEFSNPGTSNSFQLQMFEGSNAIRFLYRDIEDQTAVNPNDGVTRLVTIGVENQDGTWGSGLSDAQIDALSTAGLASGQARVFQLVPNVELSVECACSTCDPVLCLGDCDSSGTVNFGDLVAALFLFGPCP